MDLFYGNVGVILRKTVDSNYVMKGSRRRHLRIACLDGRCHTPRKTFFEEDDHAYLACWCS